MGIYSLEEDNSADLVNFPIYPGSLMVVNKPYGMNYDDTLTLPYALFITESSLDEVVGFYQNKLNYYEMLLVGDQISFVDRLIDGGVYPESYYRIPNISIREQIVHDNKKITMLSIMYEK